MVSLQTTLSHGFFLAEKKDLEKKVLEMTKTLNDYKNGNSSFIISQLQEKNKGLEDDMEHQKSLFSLQETDKELYIEENTRLRYDLDKLREKRPQDPTHHSTPIGKKETSR
jgi:hypothetical protein